MANNIKYQNPMITLNWSLLKHMCEVKHTNMPRSILYSVLYTYPLNRDCFAKRRKKP